MNIICRSHLPVIRAAQGDSGEEIWMPTGNVPGTITKKLELVRWDFEFRAGDTKAI